jgi:predicted nucleic acid-binding protein
MAAVVIADASPLIALVRVDGLSWLRALFGEVLVTIVVVGEVLTGCFPATEAPI